MNFEKYETSGANCKLKNKRKKGKRKCVSGANCKLQKKKCTFGANYF